jgi:hypothetical protein
MKVGSFLPVAMPLADDGGDENRQVTARSANTRQRYV